MDASSWISPGDPWKPESSGRFNAVSDILNGVGIIGTAGQKNTGAQNSVLICRNSGNQNIAAGPFVTITGIDEAVENAEMTDWIFSVLPGIRSPYGVLAAECAPGEIGEVQVAGVAEAALSPAPSDVLRLAEKDGKALYLLSSSGGAQGNYFAVSAVGHDADGFISRVRIYDGADPDSGSAGMTDLYEIGSAELEVSSGHRYICLNLACDSNGSKREYLETFSAEYTVPSEQTPSVILAEIADGGKRLIQRWTSGRVYWRHRFVIPFYRGMF